MTDHVVMVGASGFGREALDALEAMIAAGADLVIDGVLDDAPSETNLSRLHERGIEYLGTTDDWLAQAPTARFVVGIGSPAIRERIARKFEAIGCAPQTVVHPRAIIGSRTRPGEGSVICAGAVLSTNVTVGRHVHVNPTAVIGHDSVLQDFVSINPAANVSGEVLVERGVLVGASATILQLLAIGEESLIGAGALVTKNVPPRSVVKGVPGKW